MDGGSGRAYALGTISGLAAAYLFYTACKWSAARSGPAYRSGAANSSGAAAAGTGPLASDLEDEILSEQFTRNIQFFGREGQQKISEAYVVVVGLGGVGSHAAHLLLRSGVGRLKLVDFDQVRPSNTWPFMQLPPIPRLRCELSSLSSLSSHTAVLACSHWQRSHCYANPVGISARNIVHHACVSPLPAMNESPNIAAAVPIDPDFLGTPSPTNLMQPLA